MNDDDLTTCFGCGRMIYQELDEIDNAVFCWIDERGYDSCAAPDFDDADRWHEPAPDFSTLDAVLDYLEVA